MKKRLNKKEKNAELLAEYFHERGGIVRLNVIWRKSRTWGYCPRVTWNGRDEPCAAPTGCGYDKESAALSEALQFVCPPVRRCHGSGVPDVTRVLAEHGLSLRKVASGPTFDAYELEGAAENV